MFTLGTGIGGGIIEDGRIIAGRHGHGAECGHIIIQMENARRCSCGGFGHLEAYASATALVQRALEALGRGDATALRRRLAARDLTARAIAEEAEAGDALARRLMRETARYLAVGAVSLMHAIDPDLVLFGGGMIAAGPGFLDDIRADIRRLALPAPAAGTRVEFAALGDDAGFIGAAGCARLAREAPR
jgi:glucokinase